LTAVPATHRKLVAVWLGPGWIWWMFFPPVLPAIVAYLGWKGAVLARQRGFQPLPY
jgi:hypothetical protein